MDEENEYAGGEPDNGNDVTEPLPQPDTDLTEPLPGTGEETEAWPDLPQDGTDPDTDTDETETDAEGPDAPAPGNRRRILVGLGAAAAIAAALGLGAWALTRPAVPEAAPAGSGSSIERPADKEAKQVKVTLTVTAEGWTPECGKVGFAAVGADGATLAEGEVAPGEPAELTLPEGPAAVSATSIPTAPDGKTTWLPASAELTAEDGASIELKLERVDLTDEAAVSAAVEALPEEQRAAAKATVEAKREDPSASRVEAAPARPAAPAAPQHQAAAPSRPAPKPQSEQHGEPAPKPQDKPSKPSGGGSSKPSQPEKVWGVVKPAWDEQVLVKAAWTETINYPAKTHVEKVDTGGRYYLCTEGHRFETETAAGDHFCETGHAIMTCPIYEDKTVVDREAWTETINHPAEYKTVHLDAVMGWI